MQFLLSNQAEGFQIFSLQERLVSELRKLATELNIHIALIIHPKKLDADDSKLSIGSIFGTAKVTQEADNVYII